MNKISANFIWGGNKTKGSYHLSALDKISRPKSAGGWGLLDLRTFGKALLCKSLSRGIFGEGPWSNIIKVKYLHNKGLEHWYRLGRIGSKYGSAIWLSFRKLERFFMKHLKWCLQPGSRILIGLDPILSGRECISIPKKILLFLHCKGFFTWDKLIVGWHGPLLIWKSADDLGLPQSIKCLWTPVWNSLIFCGFFQSRPQDYLVWNTPTANSQLSVKDIYSLMISSKRALSAIFPLAFWKLSCSPKMLYFSWLVYYNKNLSWENLMKRQWHGPSRCCMCESAEETNLHMFFKCTSLLEIWQVMENLYGFPLVSHASSQDAFIWWSQQKESWRPVILIVLWCAWRWRNNKLFNDAKEPLKDICQSIILIYDSIPKILPNPSAINRNV